MNAREFDSGFEDWDIGEEYKCLALIGKGSYGSVVRGVHVKSGKPVAIKQIKGVFDNETDCKRILREIKLLRQLHHPYIIELYDIVEPTNLDSFNDVYLVLEYMENDLKKVVKSAIFLTPVHIKYILYNLLCALYYLHSTEVLHRDLKPANVLINEELTVKICDFGLARSIATKEVEQDPKEEIKETEIEANDKKAGEETAVVTHDTNSTTNEASRGEENVNFQPESNNGNGAHKEDEGEEEKEEGAKEIGFKYQDLDSKTFEPTPETPRMKFKKPTKKKKRASVPGQKRTLKTGIISIGGGGIISSMLGNSSKTEVKKDEDSDKPTDRPNSINSLEIKPKKREEKEVKKGEEEKEANKEDSKELVVNKRKTIEIRKPAAKNTNIKSDLSVHVVTRWYRSPEIILLRKDYGPPIDVWSVGCIFAELLSMIRGNSVNAFSRQAIFPGSSCFPLSPGGKSKGGNSEKEDQLCVIIKQLGTPTQEDVDFISDESALNYLKRLPKAEKKNFMELYPQSSPDAIDLLNKMLCFNPHKRASIKEILEHEHLQEVRNPAKEIASQDKIILDFDFERCNTEKLRKLFAQEIIYQRNFFRRAPRHGGNISKVENELITEGKL